MIGSSFVGSGRLEGLGLWTWLQHRSAGTLNSARSQNNYGRAASVACPDTRRYNHCNFEMWLLFVLMLLGHRFCFIVCFSFYSHYLLVSIVVPLWALLIFTFDLHVIYSCAHSQTESSVMSNLGTHDNYYCRGGIYWFHGHFAFYGTSF